MDKHKIVSERTKDWAVLGKLLAYVPFVIPLVYFYPAVKTSDTELYRAVFIITLGMMAAILLLLGRARIRRPKTWEIVALGFATVMTISMGFAANKSKAIFGITGDYQGLLVQLASLALAYLASLYIKGALYWKHAANITGLVCLVSILSDVRYIVQGYRLSGLLLHATGMGLYASITLGINLVIFHKQKSHSSKESFWRATCILSAFFAVILSASRISLLASILTLLLVATTLPRLRRQVVITIAGFAITASLSYTLLSPVQRLSNPRSVETGISYRMQLYKWSLRQAQPTLLGVGTSQIDTILLPSSRVAVPPVIEHTILYDYPLWYTHSQFIDIYIQYGVIGLVLFGYLIIVSITRVFQNARKKITHMPLEVVMVGILLVAVVFHLLVNTPSLELLPMVWLAIFGSLRLSYKRLSEVSLTNNPSEAQS